MTNSRYELIHEARQAYESGPCQLQPALFCKARSIFLVS